MSRPPSLLNPGCLTNITGVPPSRLIFGTSLEHFRICGIRATSGWPPPIPPAISRSEHSQRRARETPCRIGRCGDGENDGLGLKRIQHGMAHSPPHKETVPCPLHPALFLFLSFSLATVIEFQTWKEGGGPSALVCHHLPGPPSEPLMEVSLLARRVPLNVVHACNKAATYGWKFGFFAGAFAGTRQTLAMLLPDYTRQLRENLGRSADENYRAVGDVVGHRLFEETAPTAGAGTLVGTLYGAASGGLKGGILGCIYAFGASTFAGLCMTGTRMASEWVEEEIERSERARNAHLVIARSHTHITKIQAHTLLTDSVDDSHAHGRNAISPPFFCSSSSRKSRFPREHAQMRCRTRQGSGRRAEGTFWRCSRF